MKKQKISGVVCLLLCLLLAGCGAQSALSVDLPFSAFTHFLTDSPLTESLPPASPDDTTSSPDASFSFTVTPTATLSATPTPAPATHTPSASTMPPAAPQAQAGVNIRHEGFGENASKIIVLDPGHQRVGISEKERNSPATDVMKAKVSYGTQGVVTRIPEYELNLAVALYTRDALLAKGYTVIMTHEIADVSISNIERTEMANDAHAALLLHIHANSIDDADAHGALTICPTKNNPACGDLYEESYRLAELLLQTYCAETGIRKEYVWKTDTMTGINWSRVPVATLEMGYMSNENEDRLMAQDSFRRTAANAIAQALDEFLNG